MVGAGFLRSCWAAKRSRCSPTAPSLSSCTAELAQGYLRHISPHLNWVFIEPRMVWSDERKELPIAPAYWRTCLPRRHNMVLRRGLDIPDRIGRWLTAVH